MDAIDNPASSLLNCHTSTWLSPRSSWQKKKLMCIANFSVRVDDDPRMRVNHIPQLPPFFFFFSKCTFGVTLAAVVFFFFVPVGAGAGIRIDCGTTVVLPGHELTCNSTSRDAVHWQYIVLRTFGDRWDSEIRTVDVDIQYSTIQFLG